MEDPTSLTAYDLYAFQAEMTESDGKRSSAWATLVKVDDGGNARRCAGKPWPTSFPAR